MAYTVSFGDSGAISSVYKLKQDADFIKEFYSQNELNYCSQTTSPLNLNNKNVKNYWEIFPNPNNGKFQIMCSDGNEFLSLIEVFSIDGKKILENKITSNKQSFVIEYPGVYLIKATDKDNFIQLKKIVVK